MSNQQKSVIIRNKQIIKSKLLTNVTPILQEKDINASVKHEDSISILMTVYDWFSMLMIVTINPISMQNIFQQITLYTKPSFKSQREH